MSMITPRYHLIPTRRRKLVAPERRLVTRRHFLWSAAAAPAVLRFGLRDRADAAWRRSALSPSPPSGNITPSSSVLSRLPSATLLWNDEFDILDYVPSGSIGSHKWWAGVPHWHSGASTDPASSYSAADSILSISSYFVNGAWTGGGDGPALSTTDGSGGGFFVGTNVFLEIRSQMLGGGTFWALPKCHSQGITPTAGVPSTYYCEHDWYEAHTGTFRGRQPANSFHTTMMLNTGGYGGVPNHFHAYWDNPGHDIRLWHKYGFWRPAGTNSVVIYIDDIQVGTVAPFEGGDQDLYLIISAGPTSYLGDGSDYTGITKITQNIDYIRIWR